MSNIIFSGYRESRGMYKRALERTDSFAGESAERIGSKTRINADVQASYNLLRKEIPGIFDKRGIEGLVVRPAKVTPSRN